MKLVNLRVSATCLSVMESQWKLSTGKESPLSQLVIANIGTGGRLCLATPSRIESESKKLCLPPLLREYDQQILNRERSVISLYIEGPVLELELYSIIR